MEDPDSRFYDPYRTKSSPGDGQGTKLNTPGSEETNPGSFGGRARGATFPDDFSPGSNYAEQKKKDIPGSEHIFIGDGDKAPIGEGVGAGNKSQPFVDSREKNLDTIDGKQPGSLEKRLRTMDKYKNVMDRTQRKVH